MLAYVLFYFHLWHLADAFIQNDLHYSHNLQFDQLRDKGLTQEHNSIHLPEMTG